MNDNPLPGQYRATIIFISLLILFSFALISLEDWEDEDYLSMQEGICFGVKNIRSNVINKFSRKNAKMKSSVIMYPGEDTSYEKMIAFFGVRERQTGLDPIPGNCYVFNPRC